VQKIKISTQTNNTCITRVRLFSNTAQVVFSNAAVVLPSPKVYPYPFTNPEVLPD